MSRKEQSVPIPVCGNFPTQCTSCAGTHSCTSGLASCAPAHRIARGSACRTSCRATNNGSLLSVTLGGDRRSCGTTDSAANYSAGISTSLFTHNSPSGATDPAADGRLPATISCDFCREDEAV